MEKRILSKPTGARLPDDLDKWLTEWAADSGQGRAFVVRAAVRLLVQMVGHLDYESRSRLVSRLAAKAPDPTVVADLIAATGSPASQSATQPEVGKEEAQSDLRSVEQATGTTPASKPRAPRGGSRR